MPELFDYQKEAVTWLKNKKVAWLGLPTRAGKTPCILMSLTGEPVLVIGPLSSLGVWKAHCADWRPDYTPIILKKFRWPKPYELCLINYERAIPAGWPDERTTLILDEYQGLKHPKTLRSKKITLIRGAISNAEGRIFGCSATPLENSPEDLWNLLEWFKLTAACLYHKGDYSPKAYRDRFLTLFDGAYSLMQRKYVWGTPKSEAKEYLHKVMFHKSKAEIFKHLPPVEYADIPIDITGEKIKALCDKFSALLAKAGLGHEDILEAYKVIPYETIFYLRKQLAVFKIPYLLEYVETLEAEDNRVVVFSCHKAPVEALDERPGWGIITGDIPEKKRTEICADFRAGILKGVACTIGCGKTAIDLAGADYMLFVDLPWNPGDWLQASARCQGPRMTHPLKVETLVVDHPVDNAVAAIVRTKTKILDAILT